MGFSIHKEFACKKTSSMKPCTNRVFVDYLVKVTVKQGPNTYFGEVGYVGRDLATTKPKYLFVDNRIYKMDDDESFYFFEGLEDNKFAQWLML